MSYLAGEGLGKGQQVLLFCPSKLNCVQICSVLMETLCPLLRDAHVELEVEGVAGAGTDVESRVRLPIILTASSATSTSTSTGSPATALTATPTPSTAQIAVSHMDSNRVFATHQRFQFNATENNSDSAKGNIDYGFLSKDGNNIQNSNSSSSSSSSSNNNNNNNKITLRNKILRDRLECISQILDLNPQADPSLLAFIACGLAYHHAGLSLQERGAVEQAFKSGRTYNPLSALLFPFLALHDLKFLTVPMCRTFMSQSLHVVHYTCST